MYSVHVCSTNDRDLPPPELGPGLNWDRLTEILLREVSAEAAGLLAEPIQDEARGQTHWHITARDDPQPVSALDDSERDRLMTRLQERRRAIQRFAASVEAEGGDANMRLAAALRSVLSVPDERQHVWSADGKPVLTAWGRHPTQQQRSGPRVIKRQSPTPSSPNGAADAASIHGTSNLAFEPKAPPIAPPPIIPGPTSGSAREQGEPAHTTPPQQDAPPPPITPQAPPTAGVAPRRSLWPAALLWALFVLLVAIGYRQLLPACGLNLPLIGAWSSHCEFKKSPELVAQQERRNALRDAIAAAELTIAENHSDCAAPQRTGERERSMPPIQRTPLRDHPSDRPLDAREAEQRRTEANGSHGKLDITLVWNGREDLDLHVYCPGGHIYFYDRAECGGTLEIDRNSTFAANQEQPIEHVTWHEEPPPGDYRIEVILFNRFDLPPRPIPFTVVVRSGDGQREYPGTIQKVKEPISVATIHR